MRTEDARSSACLPLGVEASGLAIQLRLRFDTLTVQRQRSHSGPLGGTSDEDNAFSDRHGLGRWEMIEQ